MYYSALSCAPTGVIGVNADGTSAYQIREVSTRFDMVIAKVTLKPDKLYKESLRKFSFSFYTEFKVISNA